MLIYILNPKYLISFMMQQLKSCADKLFFKLYSIFGQNSKFKRAKIHIKITELELELCPKYSQV